MLRWVEPYERAKELAEGTLRVSAIPRRPIDLKVIIVASGGDQREPTPTMGDKVRVPVPAVHGGIATEDETRQYDELRPPVDRVVHAHHHHVLDWASPESLLAVVLPFFERLTLASLSRPA